MPARLTAYPPDGPAVIALLEEGSCYRIGRSSECEFRIQHASVSRFHAEIEGTPSRWHLRDTGSKNGLRVAGHMLRSADLAGTSNWFSVGDVHCLMEELDEAQATQFRQSALTRQARARELSARLQPDLGMSTLIPQTLETILQLTGLERGMVLFAAAGEALRLRAARGLDRRELASRAFAGSASALDRAIESGEIVVCSDTEQSPWLGARPSVRLGGIRSLVCLPLRLQGGASAVIYADSREPGHPVTQLDIDLIRAVAGQAATAMECAHINARVDELMRALAPDEADAPSWEALRAEDP